MIIFSIVITYCLSVAAFAPYMAALQQQRYRPWRLPPLRVIVVTAVLLAYNVALSALWQWLLPASKWSALYLVAAYLPHAVRFALRVPTIRVRRTARMLRLWLVAAAISAVPAVLASVYGSLVY